MEKADFPTEGYGNEVFRGHVLQNRMARRFYYSEPRAYCYSIRHTRCVTGQLFHPYVISGGRACPEDYRTSASGLIHVWRVDGSDPLSFPAHGSQISPVTMSNNVSVEVSMTHSGAGTISYTHTGRMHLTKRSRAWTQGSRLG